MDIAAAYDQWSSLYDSNENKTRDLDATALRTNFKGMHFQNILEWGCGTGKNTEWLATICGNLTAVDLSPGMLAIAKEKVTAQHVQFMEGNLLHSFPARVEYDLVCCNLVMEHLEDLRPPFGHISAALKSGGFFYCSELHPFKQYAGSRARFEKDGETVVVPCFTHHISDFLDAAETSGLKLVSLKEWFDDNDRSIPRLLTLLFSK